MAFRLRQSLKLGCKRRLGGHGSAIALIALSALLASPAHAQGSAVTVDNNVLDRLGPSPTLPSKSSGHKTTPAKTPAKTASSHDQIHLIPPKSRQASAALAAPSHPALTHQQAAVSASPKPAVAALAAPVAAPAPKQPASASRAATPVVPPPPPRVVMEAPPAAIASPSEPAGAAKPPAAAPTVATQAATPASMPAASPITTPSTSASATAPATPAAPSAAAAPVAAPPPVQMAAATTAGSGETAVKFRPGITDLGTGAQPVLDALANRLLANQQLRVQLVSHATGAADDAMEARRVSLARAVAVRGYLVGKGVQSQRIDVRTLGNHVDSGPVADQLDLVVVSQ
jgi:outer membrane protein OmpA-like peptidoglycan-associated protein